MSFAFAGRRTLVEARTLMSRISFRRFWPVIAFLTFFSCAKHEEHDLLGRLPIVTPDSLFYSTLPSLVDRDTLVPISTNAQAFVVPRLSKMSKYPCTSCHTKPLAQMKSKDVRRAHWDIQLKHAQDGLMTCLTCHTESNFNVLHNIAGDSISFNAGFELCGQCHFNQIRDWRGGAHGKRAGGWTPPRTIYACVQCHNPHRPAFEKRWPSIPSNLMDRIRTK